MRKMNVKLLKGFRDFLPEHQIIRQKMFNIIRKTYENFGFIPLETPVLEYAEILLGKYGEEGEKLMYKFKDKGNRNVAMRYDLTIPLARVIAQYPDIRKPFKRYQIAPVWRADNPQKGRYREFYQCDADIIGTKNITADAEIIALMHDTLKNLGIDDFIIKVNNRKILNGLIKSLGVDRDKNTDILKTIDKIGKISLFEISNELKKIGLNDKKIKKIIEFVNIKVQKLGDFKIITKRYPDTIEGINEMKQMIEMSEILIGQSNNITADFSISRGLDYYTGNVFETFLTTASNYGSIFSGGRFDNLIGLFSGDNVPAVGASIGIDRLFSALLEFNIIKCKKSTARVLVTFLEKNMLKEYLSIVKYLRNNNVNTFFYFDNVNLKKQIKFALKNEIRYIIIYGDKEKSKNELILKDLSYHKQHKIRQDKLLSYIT